MKRFLQFSISLLMLFCLSAEVTYGQVGTQVPLNPKAVPQFVDPLPHFAGQRVDATDGGDLTVKMVSHDQTALSTGTVVNGGVIGGAIDPLINPSQGKAHLWVYQISTNGEDFTPPLWPAFTIEAQRGNALYVKYENHLDEETYANVGLKVDQTLHWALPMVDPAAHEAYEGEIPTTVHLHGGEVPPLSDGGPDSWFTPGAIESGHSYNAEPYFYPNTQEAATLWFHDHALGLTRLNVYAGLAGFYFLRGADENTAQLPGWSGDDMVREVAVGLSAPFNPVPYLPEIEIVIQDRMFDTDGKLYFPNLPTNPTIHPVWTPEFEGDIITVNGKTWPHLSVAPRKYRFRLLNGSNARAYELWLQDLATGTLGPIIYQVGTDGGLLDAPVAIDPALGGKLVLMPGERADVVIDFTGQMGSVWTMRNSAKTPYPAGAPVPGATLGRIMQFVVNGAMVKEDGSPGSDFSSLPTSLKSNVKLTDFAGQALVPVDKIRQLTLNEVMGPGGPLEALVNNTKWGGESVDNVTYPGGIRPEYLPVVNIDATDVATTTYYSEIIDEGSTEIWKIINLTGDAHPIHLHLVQLQLMSRQKFNTNKYNKVYNALFPGKAFIGGFGPPLDYTVNQTPAGPIPTIGGNPDITPFLQGPVKPANPNERGWKDTFIMYPGEVTTVIARWAPTDKAANTSKEELFFPFDPNGGHGYVWHCHIIDHEDNEMMRPYLVNPNPFNPLSAAGIAPSGSLKGASVEVEVFPGRISAQQSSDQLIERISEVVLEQNIPNPFSGETQIRFILPEAAHVQLTLINSLGQVQTLIDAEAPAGLNTAMIDAGDLKGGIYFYQLRTGNVTLMKKMVVLK